MKPADIIIAWRKTTTLNRIRECRAMLHLHGFLSEKENAKVKQRINKWVETTEKESKP
jgi:hypothetical protein